MRCNKEFLRMFVWHPVLVCDLKLRVIFIFCSQYSLQFIVDTRNVLQIMFFFRIFETVIFVLELFR